MVYFLILLFLFVLHFYANRHFGFTSPSIYIYLFPFVYFIIKYFLYVALSLPALDGLHQDDFNLAGAYFLLFFLICFISYYISLIYQAKEITVISLAPRIRIGTAAYGILITVFLFLISKNGLDTLTQPYRNRLVLTSQGMAYIYVLYQFLCFSFVVSLMSQRNYTGLIVFSVIYSVMAFLTSSAASQLWLLLTIIMSYGMVHRNKVLKYILILPVFIVPYLIFTGVHRVHAFNRNVTLEEITELLRKTFDQGYLLGALTKILHRIDQLESFTLLVNALDRGRLEYGYGESLWKFLIQWVPRSIWPDKPLNFTNEMTMIFRPEVYYSSAANNFTGIGEFIYNFGWVGLFVGGIIFGISTAWAQSVWRSSSGSYSHALILIVVVYPFLVSGLLAGFINDFALPAVMLNILFIHIFFKVRVRKHSRSVGNNNVAVQSLQQIGSRADLPRRFESNSG